MRKFVLLGLFVALSTRSSALSQSIQRRTAMMDVPTVPRSSTPQLRLLTSQDNEIVWEFLKHAAHEDDDVRSMPLLQPYGEEFGLRKGDLGVVAFLKDSEVSDKHEVVVGAAWIRQLHDKGGFCSSKDKLPELAMGVSPAHRGQGIGTLLLETLMHRAQHVDGEQKPGGICLSCRTENKAALALYRKLGFDDIEGSEIPNRAGGTSISMVHHFPNITDDETNVRFATKEDASTILELIRRKADFDHSVGGTEKTSSTLEVTEENLLQTLFPDDKRAPYAYVVLAEKAGIAAGFASYHFRYSTFSGRPSLWLDDLFVDERFRSGGIGPRLMRKLVNDVAPEHDCTHVGWSAAKRNTRGLSFYSRLGATVLDPDEGILHLKLEPNSL